LEDPVLIRQAMQDLFRQESEFPVKVEGTHTLPYSARIHHLDPQKGFLHLKLIRPLPHELVAGALFEMVFTWRDQRFEAQTIFQGRESYLLYQFTLPSRIIHSDRRSHKRYPFRPREKAYVVAQDGGIPGYGLSGPLVNLSEGGLAFRLDRVMRLDDHLRVTPGLGFFDRGKALPMLKIRDLPNLPLFESRGVLAFVLEREGEFIVGLQFGELGESERRELQGVLTIREHMKRAPLAAPTEGPRATASRAPAESKGPASPFLPAGRQTPDALRLLSRRGTRVLLAMEPGPERDQIRQVLGAAGFLRMDAVDTVEGALADLRGQRGATAPLLLLAPHPGIAPPLGELRSLQREWGERQELAVGVLLRPGQELDPTDPLLRPLPWPGTDAPTWLPHLDDLAGLV
jgi:hypothetical protein